MALKTTKCFGISSTNEVKYLYAENYKTLLIGIEEDTNKGKVSHVSRLEKNIFFSYNVYISQSKSTDSMQSLSIFQWHFSQKQINNPKIHKKSQNRKYPR